MDDDMETRLTQYLELLEKVKEKVSNEDTAARIVSEVAKDRRVEQMHRNGSSATEKQKAFMDKLGIDYDEDVSKKKASNLIDQELGRNGQ